MEKFDKYLEYFTIKIAYIFFFFIPFYGAAFLVIELNPKYPVAFFVKHTTGVALMWWIILKAFL